MVVCAVGVGGGVFAGVDRQDCGAARIAFAVSVFVVGVRVLVVLGLRLGLLGW